MEAMQKEVVIASADKSVINTIYFGGGTPSLLTATEIKKLMEVVRLHFDISSDAEITLEANPDDIAEQKLIQWKEAGINRLSIGVQSFKDADLVWMNRAHTAGQALQCIELVKEVGFTNFSVDLIYGTPTLSDDEWEKNVDTIVQLGVPHISCYALTVEPGTALQKMITLHKKEAVDTEKQAAHFFLLMDWLVAAGYEHYEISNFAKPGFRSQHNSSYWQGTNYIGIGPSAHSYNGHSRRWNVSNNALYIQALKKGSIPFEIEKLTDVQRLNEYIMTSLRTIEGINLDFVQRYFGEEKKNELQNVSDQFIANGKLQYSHHRLVLTNAGKLFADGITAELFFEEGRVTIIV